MDEFGVGELFDVCDGDFDDGAEVAGQGGSEVPAEALVEGFEGAHLVFGDAFGAFEVVDGDVGGGGAAAVHGRGGRRGFGGDLAGIHGGEEGVYFGLVENVSQGCGLLAALGIIGLVGGISRLLEKFEIRNPKFETKRQKNKGKRGRKGGLVLGFVLFEFGRLFRVSDFEFRI